MGNSCCGLYKYSSSSMVWAAADDNDDDWISVSEASDNSINNKPINVMEKQSLLFLDDQKKKLYKSTSSSSSSTHDTYREVKIKISKKELEELVGRGDVHGNIHVDQVLSRLLKLNASRMINHYYDQRSVWRPILQTIPELN